MHVPASVKKSFPALPKHTSTVLIHQRMYTPNCSQPEKCILQLMCTQPCEMWVLFL